jgi:prepilin-type N-terminal cleavage/methylation domain-containing protein
MIRSLRADRGFTLIEMLITIALIAVFMELLTPTIKMFRETAVRAQDEDSLRPAASQALHVADEAEAVLAEAQATLAAALEAGEAPDADRISSFLPAVQRSLDALDEIEEMLRPGALDDRLDEARELRRSVAEVRHGLKQLQIKLEHLLDKIALLCRFAPC